MRSNWEREVREKQRNILPRDTIRNAATVDGTIIRGDKRLTPVQRAGAVILGVLYSAPGVAGFIAGFLLPFERGPSSLPRWQTVLLIPGVFLVSAGFLYIGTRAVLNGIRGGGTREDDRQGLKEP